MSATCELHFCNFWHIFGRGTRSGFIKKIGGKKSRATVPLGKFSVSRETDSSKNIFGWFLKPSWAEERVPKVAILAGDCRELRNCGSQILKVRNRSSATFLVRNSAIDLVVRNIAELWRCGLKLRMPSFGYCPRSLKCLFQMIIVRTDWTVRLIIFQSQSQSRNTTIQIILVPRYWYSANKD
jgi:hypothetical protein